jgi:hypothetical protein
MAVRNFWIEVEIDGRKTKLSGGSQLKTGGMTIKLFQRNKGEITKALSVDCLANDLGILATEVFNENSVEIHRIITER